MATENNNPEWGSGRKPCMLDKDLTLSPEPSPYPFIRQARTNKMQLGKTEATNTHEQLIPPVQLELSIAALEGANFGRAFASGMAPKILLRLLDLGDHVIMGNDAYGHVPAHIKSTHTIRNLYSSTNLSNPDEVKAAFKDKTKMIWAETPTNPLLSVVDIELLATLSHDKEALLVVDNTFADPLPFKSPFRSVQIL